MPHLSRKSFPPCMDLTLLAKSECRWPNGILPSLAPMSTTSNANCRTSIKAASPVQNISMPQKWGLISWRLLESQLTQMISVRIWLVDLICLTTHLSRPSHLRCVITQWVSMISNQNCCHMKSCWITNTKPSLLHNQALLWWLPKTITQMPKEAEEFLSTKISTPQPIY